MSAAAAAAAAIASTAPRPCKTFVVGGGRRFSNPRTPLLFSSPFLPFPSPPAPPLSLAATSRSSAAAPLIPCSGGGSGGGEAPLFSAGREDEEGGAICPGCGVYLQDADPNLPGFYREPSPPKSHLDSLDPPPDSGDLSGEDDDLSDGGAESRDLGADSGGEEERDSDWEDLGFSPDEEAKRRRELDGFRPFEEEEAAAAKISKSERKKKAREERRKEVSEEDDGAVVCTRCYSLRNYGQVKNSMAENLVPDFDFDRLVAPRLMRPTVRAPVVVMVVDCVDFDGSFPRRAARSLLETFERMQRDDRRPISPKLVLVATKVDLLPSQISPTRLDRWVRHRAMAAGAPKLNAVYLVSAKKDLGVRNLIAFVKELAGPRGNVWIVGAQNAGKSTLINTFAKKEGAKVTRLTEAAVPGTTLGILRVKGILPAKGKLFDTPGLLHPYLMSMRLNREEQKMIEIRKELRPRTYRTKPGQTVHVGGLMRLDVLDASVNTVYVTVWASPNVSLHMGKTESADELQKKHLGIRLQPPIGPERVSELGEWAPTDIKARGTSWVANDVDIAVSGLGWISLGLKGECHVRVWTFDGVEVTQREPLVLDRAPLFERPGFSLPKAISDAIGGRSKGEAEERSRVASSDPLAEATAL